jgi:HTH-type transcriptional regulator / antitoxin HipB
MTTIGEQVRARRRELHLGQVELSELAGVSPTMVRTIEHDKATVQLDKVRAVLNVLGLELTVTMKT